MTELEFIRIEGATEIFYAKISVDTGATLSYLPKLISFGNFTIGSDEAENEMILYPSNFVICFLLDTIEDYYLVMGCLRDVAAEIEVRRDSSTGDLRFKGVSMFEAIEGDATKRTITMTFYDDFKQLSEAFVRPADADVDYFTLDDIILDTLGIDFAAVEIVTDMLFSYLDGATPTDFPISEFAIHRKNKFFNFKWPIASGNPPVYSTLYQYSSKGQVLVSLLNQFASFGVLGLDRTFYILPRFYSGRTLINIAKMDTYDGLFKTSFTKKFRGLRIYEKHVDVFFQPFHLGEVLIKEDTYADLEFPDEVESIYLPAGLNTYDESGTVPGTAIQVRRKSSGGTLYYVEINYSKYKMADGTYSTAKALLDWVTNIIWSNIKNARKKYFIEMKGTGFDFTQFFTIEGETSKFRPVKISYNFMKDSTELTLVECPTIEEFSVIEG